VSTPTPTPTPYQAGTPPVVPAGYAPVAPRRPPLTGREKRGAVWAGIVGFNLLTLGFWIFILPFALALAGFFIVAIFGLVARSLHESDIDLDRFLGSLGNVDLTPWIVPGILVAVVGLAVMAVAIVVSRAILKGHGVNRPTAVTWSGAGVAIVAFWVLSWIPGIAVQLVSFALNAGGVDGWTNAWVSGGASVLLALVTNSVIGWLAWWWMAHAFRRATRTATTTAVQE
jgi:hypothetical protein